MRIDRQTLVGKKIVKVTDQGLIPSYGDDGLRSLILHFDDGSIVKLTASTVMFDQFSSDPVLRVEEVEVQ